MKKITILSILTISLTAVFAQGATSVILKENKFEAAMLSNIRQLDTASASTLSALANNFERIGSAEKNKWQPFYYAAYCYTVIAFMSEDKSRIDELADRAEKNVESAILVDNNNSEITALSAMILSCKIMVDPMTRFPTLGRDVSLLISKAKDQNADNPRIYLLEARMQIRTPEAFGGGKKIAKQTIEVAISKFEKFVAADKISPSWGIGQAKAMLEKMNSQ